MTSASSSPGPDSTAAPPGGRVAVVGTMVWDTIHRAGEVHRAPAEEWGGISYALEAFSAALDPAWEVVPVVKLGRDLAESARDFLRRIPGVECDEGLKVVDEPNNRVELRYQNEDRRTERLRGGVPPWTAEELLPLVTECDAVYVNFISGMEMGLEAALGLREAFSGPIYADLHSLFLSVGRGGLRIPRELPSWRRWLEAFDAIQMNESEFELLGRTWGDPWRLAADVVGPHLKLIAVTLGARGAAYVVAPEFEPDPGRWSGGRDQVANPGPSRSGKVAQPGGPRSGDPTGCGDVWGATFFAGLLSGKALEEAMEDANHAAARNVEHRGAERLHLHLQGRIR